MAKPFTKEERSERTDDHLRARLQQAEERGVKAWERVKELEAERDTATKRMRRMRAELTLAMAGYKVEVLADFEKRAEAAERYARQQEASAETARERAERYWWTCHAAKRENAALGKALREAAWWLDHWGERYAETNRSLKVTRQMIRDAFSPDAGKE